MRILMIFFFALSLLVPLSATAKSMNFYLGYSGGNCNDCVWIVADGEIEKDTPNKFLEFLKEKNIDPGESLRVSFNSIGGHLIAGLELGKLIREYKFNTSIFKTSTYLNDAGEKTSSKQEDPGICFSSCAYAFLGGIERRISNKSKYGIHQFYTADSLKNPVEKKFSSLDISRNQVISGALASYISEMGVDTKLLGVASVITPWEDIYLLPEEIIIKYNIDNTKPTPPKWKIQALGEGMFAYTFQKQYSSEAGTKKLSVYCFSEKPEITLRFDGYYEEKNIRKYYNGDIESRLKNSKAIEIEYAKGKHEPINAKITSHDIKIEDGRMNISQTVKIKNSDLKKIINAEKIETTQYTFGQRYFFVYYSVFHLSIGKKEILLALNNCI